jgi:hypothetical protein
MLLTFFMFFVMQSPSALLFFPIVWLCMRTKDGQRLSVGNLWLIGGLLATALGAGLVRYLSVFVIGGDAALNPSDEQNVVFSLILPIVVAIGVCAFLRTKAKPTAIPKTA